jgi:hypothetical protein
LAVVPEPARPEQRERRLAFGERGVENRCRFHRLAISLHMHVHREGLIAEEMIVQCSHPDPTSGELLAVRTMLAESGSKTRGGSRPGGHFV